MTEDMILEASDPSRSAAIGNVRTWRVSGAVVSAGMLLCMTAQANDEIVKRSRGPGVRAGPGADYSQHRHSALEDICK